MILDFLYYCCYCAVLKGKKYGSGEERASFMLSIIISIYSIALYFITCVKLQLRIMKPFLVSGLSFGLVVGTVYGLSYFFVKTQRYVALLNEFRSKKLNKPLLGTIAWILFITSFIAFGLAGMTFSKYHN
jgi:hypothetical protein